MTDKNNNCVRRACTPRREDQHWENSSFREFCSQGWALRVCDQQDAPRTLNSYGGNVGRMMRLGTSSKSCLCPCSSKGERSQRNGRHPGSLIKDYIPTGAPSLPPVHLFWQTNQPEGAGGEEESARWSVRQISTQHPRGWGRTCQVKSGVDNEEPQAKLWIREGKIPQSERSTRIFIC